jgi:hypothetical protein
MVLGDSYVDKLHVYGSALFPGALDDGSYAKEVVFKDCYTYGTLTAEHIKSDANHRNTVIAGSGGPGLLIDNCQIVIGDRVTIEDNTEAGVEVTNAGILEMQAALGGTGNGTCGVHAHRGAKVFPKSGSAPTITGGVSIELSFDGSTEQADWATVNTTPQVEGTTDQILAKAV